MVEAKAFLDGELLADVEIFFAHLDNSRANQIFGPKNFVFTQQLLGRPEPGPGPGQFQADPVAGRVPADEPVAPASGHEPPTDR